MVFKLIHILEVTLSQIPLSSGFYLNLPTPKNRERFVILKIWSNFAETGNNSWTSKKQETDLFKVKLQSNFCFLKLTCCSDVFLWRGWQVWIYSFRCDNDSVNRTIEQQETKLMNKSKNIIQSGRKSYPQAFFFLTLDLFVLFSTNSTAGCKMELRKKERKGEKKKRKSSTKYNFSSNKLS